MPVILNRFDEDNPLTLEAVNANFQALVAVVNSLAGENAVQLGVLLDDSPQYMPKAGGTFLGQVVAPSILIGTAPVVTTATAATAAVRGAVKQASALAAMATAIGNPPTQSQVTELRDLLNSLIAALKAAEQMATS